MRIQTIRNAYQTEYTVRFLGLLRQTWTEQKEFNCIGSAKPQHLFLLLNGCSASYVFKDGTRLEATDGQLVYTPKGSEYKVAFHSFQGEHASTLGVNFFLFDENGAEFSLANNAEIFPLDDTLSMLFNEAERLSFSPVRIPAKFNAILYNVLSELGQAREKELHSKSNFKFIEPALTYLNEHFKENTSVEELAALCRVSTVYFRKLFKRHTGKSPTEYRIFLRLKAAEQYLKYGELSVGELARELGYSDAAYFIKQFKEEFAVSPLSYRSKSKL